MRDFINIVESHASLIEDFTEGYCYGLALELNRRFGWELGVVAGEDDSEGAEHPFYTVHAFNYLPNGLAIDIEGVHSEEDLHRAYAGDEDGWTLKRIERNQLVSMLNPALIDLNARSQKYIDQAVKYLQSEEPEPFEFHGSINETIEWKKSGASARDVVVQIDVAKVDASASKDRNFYVGPQGSGGIKGRYERFSRWMERGETVEMPEVCLTDQGEISFINGRHRFAWMRDNGVTTMPVAVPANDAAGVKERFSA